MLHVQQANKASSHNHTPKISSRAKMTYATKKGMPAKEGSLGRRNTICKTHATQWMVQVDTLVYRGDPSILFDIHVCAPWA